MSKDVDSFLRQLNYPPKGMVNRGKQYLLDLYKNVRENHPQKAEDLYVFSHRTTEAFNKLEDELIEAGRDGFETTAREAIAESIWMILDSTGIEYDAEEAIAPREW